MCVGVSVSRLCCIVFTVEGNIYRVISGFCLDSSAFSFSCLEGFLFFAFYVVAFCMSWTSTGVEWLISVCCDGEEETGYQP